MDALVVKASPTIGIIVIGRNEGERLKHCLNSLKDAPLVVYVDSGSTDGSLQYAEEYGVAAVALSIDKPFTAARARNTGLAHLLAQAPGLDFVQMVDGDCVIDEQWLSAAAATLLADPMVAAVFGRLRERHPERSIYNQICDDEWNVSVGEVESCGGNALHRVKALMEAGGFNDTLIAGEEPDLCLKLSRAGWKIRRIDAEMGQHDAAILRFGQWWRRSVRSGHAYAEHIWLHHSHSLPSWKRQMARIVFWAAILPLLIICSAFVGRGGGLPTLALLAIYPAQFLRQWLRSPKVNGATAKMAALALIDKFPGALGALQFWTGKLGGKRRSLIEYKSNRS
jgi:glycosyltransferase involved in cell wall biosynthesis